MARQKKKKKNKNMTNFRVLDETSQRADQPRGPPGSPPVGVLLRPHQLALLHRCREMETRPFTHHLGDRDGRRFPSLPGHEVTVQTRVGVIGDRAGAGKSYVMLSLVLEDKRESAASIAEEHRMIPFVCSLAGNRVVVTAQENVSTAGLTLMVIPHNLCNQWTGYIDAFGGGLETFVVSRAKHVETLRESLVVPSESESDGPRAAPFDRLDLVVVTSTFYNAVANELRHRQVRRVMFDEADAALPNCHPIKAGFAWFATASYRNLLCPHGEGATLTDSHGMRTWLRTTRGLTSSGFIKNTFYQLHDSAVARAAAEALVVRNSDAFVDASISLPDPVVEIVRCRAPVVVRMLNGFVDSEIMQALNAGDVASAMQHINPSNRGTEENVVAALLQRLRHESENCDAMMRAADSMHFPSEAHRAAHRAPHAARKEEVEAKMRGIRERVASSESCSICYDDLQNKTVVPCCSNAFCFACINRWIAQKGASAACPLCKAAVSVRSLLVVSPEGPVPPPAASSSPVVVDPSSLDKLGNFDRIMRERCAVPGVNKVLVFSSFDNTFVDITQTLNDAGIRWKYLKGNGGVVASISREFRTGTLDVLLVNSNHYGSGLNFENTTDVVMWHKFDTDIEHQIVGRAQRSGRTCPLKVWYLMHENE